MAKKLTPNGADGPATKDHNVKHIRETIRSVADAVIGLKAARSEINAQITEERAKLKAFGIKMVDFNAMVRLYELEAEDRNESVDAIRLMWEGLGLGGQGDLFPEPPTPSAEPPKGSKKSKGKQTNGTAAAKGEQRLRDADEAGKAAALAGKSQVSNPHNKITEAHERWDLGWQAGHRQLQDQQGWDAETENQKGVKAGLAGEDRDSNPWVEGHEAHDYWDRGWIGGQRQVAAKGKLEGNGAAAPEPQPAA